MRPLHIPALALVIAMLAGCSDDPEPLFADPSPSETAQPTAEPSTAEPEPEPWEENSPDGAIAFVEHWIDTFNESNKTGDIEVLDQLSHPRCQTCNSFMSLTEEVYKSGGRIQGRGWDLKKPTYTSPDDGKNVAIAGVMSIPKQSIFRENEEMRSPAINRRYTFQLEWNAGAWTTRAILKEAS